MSDWMSPSCRRDGIQPAPGWGSVGFAVASLTKESFPLSARTFLLDASASASDARAFLRIPIALIMRRSLSDAQGLG